MEQETMGRVVSVAKQRWLKVNRKPVRAHALDGAVFPHIIKVAYAAEGRDYTLRKWISAGSHVPAMGSAVKVRYRAGRPSKARVEI